MTKELNHRARKILHAVVSEFLQTGDAVGSRKITRRHGIELSPATVRNVMSDLEEMGLLSQPHTSAGRIPSGAGLRFFVDSLLRVRGLSRKEKDDIRGQFENPRDLEGVMNRASRVLSEMTLCAGVVLAPNLERQRLSHIEFVPMGTGRYLCVLVTNDGMIENKLVQVDATIDARRLDSIHNYLAELLGGLTLDEVRQRVLAELGEEKNRYDELTAAALALSKEALTTTAKSADVIVSGRANLIEHGALDDDGRRERMRELLRAFEEKEVIVRLLDETMTSERIQVFIGSETSHEVFEDSSVVAMKYGPGEHPLGAIAVIGPRRMNYGKVMSVVDFTADLVSKLVTES